MNQEQLLHMLEERASTGKPDRLRDVHAPGIDLRGRSLAGIVFENADLTGALLSDCDLDSASLVGCALDGGDLERANLYKATISRSSLCHVNLRRANLRRSNIHSSALAGANLANADFTRATGSDIDLRGADLMGTIFFETVIKGVRAHGVRGAWLRPDDNWLEGVDMSVDGDGSNMRDPVALIDQERGQVRPIRIRLSGIPGAPIIVREEPNAPEREVDLESLPLDDETRVALRTWRERRDDLQHAVLPAVDEEGRRLWRSLMSSLVGYHIRYEPAQNEAIDEMTDR